MRKSSVKILKNNGDLVPFSRDKLITSLSNSGASNSDIEKVTAEIENLLFEGISTKVIYKKTYEKLRKLNRPNASRYNLKKGIMELGPTGFPFEKFVGELLKYLGYKVKVGVIVQGNCVQHEVDVVAEKDNKHFMIECKYHSSFKTKCNVKIPLYIQSRFLDIEKQWIKLPGHQHKFHQGWIVNNTRFTKDAIDFGECVGLNLISWDYPENNSLKDLISKSGLYPISCLSTLLKSEKQELFNNNIVLCKQLCENFNILSKLNINQKRHKQIMEDANELCKSSL